MKSTPAILFFGATLCTFAAFSASAADFTWDAPSGCPDRDALRWRIEEALGTSLAQAAPLNFTAKVEENSATRWVVTLDATSDANQGDVQHRELQASSCDELAQAVSVAIALALGADVSEPKGSPPETPVSSKAETAPPQQAALAESGLSRAAAPPKKESDSKNSFWWAADLGPTVDMGSLPNPALGIEVSGLAGKGAFGVKLGGLALPNRSGERDGYGGTFTLLAASLMACGNASHAPTTLRLCGGSELGRLSGKAMYTTDSWTGNSSWVARPNLF